MTLHTVRSSLKSRLLKRALVPEADPYVREEIEAALDERPELVAEMDQPEW